MTESPAGGPAASRPVGLGRVLFVCTGNVCRSPLMERLLIHLVGPDRIEAASAGLAALVGEPMSANAATEVVRLGADPRGFAARQLTADLVTDADLVLTATRAHRAGVVSLVPCAARHTFALLELARLLPFVEASSLPTVDGSQLAGLAADGSQVAGLATGGSQVAGLATGGSQVAGLAAAAAASRGLTPPVPAGADDILDPYRRDAAVYRQATDAIVPAVTALAAILNR